MVYRAKNLRYPSALSISQPHCTLPVRETHTRPLSLGYPSTDTTVVVATPSSYCRATTTTKLGIILRRGIKRNTYSGTATRLPPPPKYSTHVPPYHCTCLVLGAALRTSARGDYRDRYTTTCRNTLPSRGDMFCLYAQTGGRQPRGTTA